MSDETSTLSRWSRLKREANAEKTKPKANNLKTEQRDPVINVTDPFQGGEIGEIGSEAQLPELAVSADNQNSSDLAIAEESEAIEEPLLTDDDMPELKTLTAESDISMFFNRGVTAALRKAALNTIFQLPKYNIRDGLNDYDEDYTVFEPLGDTVTCDMKFHQRRKEREAREAEELAEQERLAQADEEALAEQSEDVEGEATEATESAESTESTEMDNDVEASDDSAETQEQNTPETDDSSTNPASAEEYHEPALQARVAPINVHDLKSKATKT